MLKLTTLATPCRTKKTDFEKKKTIRICYFRSKIGFFDFLYRPNFCYCFFFFTLLIKSIQKRSPVTVVRYTHARVIRSYVNSTR